MDKSDGVPPASCGAMMSCPHNVFAIALLQSLTGACNQNDAERKRRCSMSPSGASFEENGQF